MTKDNQDIRSAFNAAMGSIHSRMVSGEVSKADGFDHQARVYRAFGFFGTANLCAELAEASRTGSNVVPRGLGPNDGPRACAYV